MIYSKKLKELRISKELKQSDIANILHVQRHAYTQYENEYVILPIKHLITICDYYNVSIDYIFDLTNTINYKNSFKNIDKNLSGKRLKDFRKENKLTQVKLAETLNTFHQVIGNYENGTNIIATPFLYTICKKYNISADYLLGKVDNPKYLNS